MGINVKHLELFHTQIFGVPEVYEIIVVPINRHYTMINIAYNNKAFMILRLAMLWGLMHVG